MNECACDVCRSFCKRKPGWYMPGEAEKSAALLGLTLKEFFDKYLSVDYWIQDGKPIFVLSPAIVGGTPGDMFSFQPCGRCVFFDDNERCRIHAAKPHECAANDHNTKENSAHKACAMAWKDHQGQIRELLGREPKMPTPDLLDMVGLLDSFGKYEY